jgi:hypothetical protein
MRFVRTLLGAFLRLTIFGAIASAIGAAIARDRMASRGQPEDDEFDLVAIMNPLDFASTAKAFRRGSYLAWYGGGTLDLRGASLDPAGATLTVRAIFGGFRLVVPASWRVENRMLGIFGGSGDGRPASMIATDGPVLVLDGWAFFGGAGIVSEAPDLDARAAEPVLA